LREKLPDFMTPSAFIALEKMPLTPNGKIDRSALPLPEPAAAHERVFVAPRNETEALVASIWSNILGIENISVFDNFFELGGHSLLATRVVFRIRETLQLDLPLRTMFLSLTIAELAHKIDRLRAGQSERRVESIRPVDRAQPLPLSFAQQRLWPLP